jgi:DNA-binding Lrp family transcriptional regulator
MLRDLLAILSGGGLETPASIAASLGTSASSVEAMLVKLEELGYIKDLSAELEASCSDAGQECSACRSCAACGGGRGKLARGGRVWSLTAKGLEAAGRS